MRACNLYRQVRQLLLDPAVNREFAALRAEVEAKGREVKALQQELQAVNFSQDSKTGRMLMAKCRTLQVRAVKFISSDHDCKVVTSCQLDIYTHVARAQTAWHQVQ